MSVTATAETIEVLQQRVHRMQGTTATRPLSTHPALTPVLQLRTGSSYVTDSSLLAMMMMSGPSQSGSWSAVIGVPDFGLEAAQSLGVVLERTVVVPDPGAAWLTVTGALVEVMGVVVVRPPASVPPTQAERLASRLRQRDAMLVALCDRVAGGGRGVDWPRAEARLTLRDSVWSGIGRGHGRLTARQATVIATQGSRAGGRERRADLWLPGTGPSVFTEPGRRADTGRVISLDPHRLDSQHRLDSPYLPTSFPPL